MRPPQNPRSSGFWLTALATTFLLGWWAGSRSGEPENSPSFEAYSPSLGLDRNRTPALEEARGPADRVTLDLGDGIEASAREQLIQPVSLEELEQYLRSGLASRNQTYRELVFSQVLSQLTAENAPTLSDAFKGEHARSGANRDTLRRFTVRWAELDGASAMLYAQMKHREDRSYSWVHESKEWHLIADVVKGWAKADWAACLSYMDHRGIIETNLLPFLEGAAAAAENLEEFEAYVAGLEDEDLRLEAVDAIGEGIKDNPRALLDWADRAINEADPDKAYVEQVSQQLVRWLGKGPALAEWVDLNGNSPQLPRSMFFEAAKSWAKTDPRAALEWVMRNESNFGATENCYNTIMREWRTMDFAGHLEWISQNLDDPLVTGERIDAAVGKWAETDPAGAADWLSRNGDDGDIKTTAYLEVAERWSLTAPDEALEWAESLDGYDQRHAMLAIAKTWPLSRIDELASRLFSMGSSNSYDWAFAQLTKRYVDIDIDVALSLPGNIVDPVSRERNLRWVGEKAIRSAPAAVTEWLPDSGLSDETQREIGNLNKSVTP